MNSSDNTNNESTQPLTGDKQGETVDTNFARNSV